MQSPFSSLPALCFGLAALLPTVAIADDAPHPYIVNQPADLVVAVGTPSGKVNLKKTFGEEGGTTGEVARFDTVLGNIDVQLRPDVAPATVANFLAYVTSGAYTNSFIHRSVPNFVIQGGGYTVANGKIVTIPELNPVVNEFHLSNTRGTIAMAKLATGPNTATDQWFFNETDNSGGSVELDTSNGGYTVFGSITDSAGLAVMDAIAALATTNLGAPFDELPVLSSYQTGSTLTVNDLVTVSSVALLPQAGDASSIVMTVKKNSNPGLVTATLSGKKLLLTYASGAKGTATLKILATDSGGSKVTAKFEVTVQ